MCIVTAITLSKGLTWFIVKDISNSEDTEQQNKQTNKPPANKQNLTTLPPNQQRFLLQPPLLLAVHDTQAMGHLRP